MTVEQLDRIPNDLLTAKDTNGLVAWLHDRGWRMSLLELDRERRRRGLRKLGR